MLNVKLVLIDQLAILNLITCNLWTMLPLSSVASALMLIVLLGCFVLDSAYICKQTQQLKVACLQVDRSSQDFELHYFEMKILKSF